MVQVMYVDQYGNNMISSAAALFFSTAFNSFNNTPVNWKKLEIIYDGWKDIDNISIKAEFTPNDLSDPLIYNPNDYL